MSNARNLFHGRISSLTKSLAIDAVSARPLTEQAHNDVARMLRNGLAVVGFAALEDFIKSRTSEVLSAIGGTSIPFRDLPEKLRDAATFEAVSALTYQLALRSKTDRMQYVQDHARMIASTATTAYELTPHAFGFDQANIQDETIKTVLKCFLVDDPWAQITRIASRLSLAALPLNETYKSAALRRHRAAHVAHADTPQADLVQFTKEALAIAVGFDALLSRALSKLQRHDRQYVSGSAHINASAISIRTISPSAGKWREMVEGRSSAVKVENSLEALLAPARQRASASNNLLIIYQSDLNGFRWECY